MGDSRIKPGTWTVGPVLTIATAPAIVVAVAMALAIGAVSLLLTRGILVLLNETMRYVTSNTKDDGVSRKRASAHEKTGRSEESPRAAEVRRNLDRLVRHVELSVQAAGVRG